MSWYRISSVAVSCALALALFAAMGTAQEEKKKGDDSKSAEKDKAKGFLSYCDGITSDNFSMYLIKGSHITVKPDYQFQEV